MIVQLTRALRVDVDGLNCTLEHRRRIEEGKRAGEVVWEAVGHYGSLGDACRAAIRKELARAGQASLAAVVERLEAADARLRELAGAISLAARLRRDDRLRAQIRFARDSFRNDGAEGETVHALCDALEAAMRGETRLGPDGPVPESLTMEEAGT